jgi:hypothetical protein
MNKKLLERQKLFREKFREDREYRFTDGEGYYQHTDDFERFNSETTRLMVEEFKNKLQENFKKYYITQKVEGNDRKKVVSYEEFVQSLTEL